MVKPPNKGHFFVERLSSSQRLKMNYSYRKGVQKSVLCSEVITFLKGLLKEVPLQYDLFHLAFLGTTNLNAGALCLSMEPFDFHLAGSNEVSTGVAMV